MCNSVRSPHCTGDKTSVPAGDVNNLPVASYVVKTVAALRAAASVSSGGGAATNSLNGVESQFVTITVENLARDKARLTVNMHSSVADLLALLRAGDRASPLSSHCVPHLTLLCIPETATNPIIPLADTQRTLKSYGITNNRTLLVIVQDGFVGGEFINLFTPGNAAASNLHPTRRVRGMALDENGHFLLACDAVGSVFGRGPPSPCLWKLDPTTGEILWQFTGVCADEPMENPQFVCMSPCGRFAWVTDRSIVFKFDIVSNTLADTLRFNHFGELAGVAASPCGNFLYIASGSAHCVIIVRVTDEKSVVRVIGGHGSGAGQFARPAGLGLSSDGETLFVADSDNHRIQVLQLGDRVDIESNLAAQISVRSVFGKRGDAPGEFDSVSDVKVSSDGLVYVVDTGHSQIKVFNAETGVHVHSIGRGGQEPGRFICPYGVALGQRAGQPVLVASDYHDGRIQAFKLPACAGIARAAGDDVHAPIVIE